VATTVFINFEVSKILGIFMSNQDKKDRDVQAKSKISEKAEKTAINERERHKGKMDKAENKARAIAGKARSKNQGHEPVSDQKSHEYH
jgi:hypothetical protein